MRWSNIDANGTRILVSIGATITILMLAFGSFTQQSVAIDVRELENATSTLGRVANALSYRRGDGLPGGARGSTDRPNYIQTEIEKFGNTHWSHVCSNPVF
jgi:hypothetical protein